MLLLSFLQKEISSTFTSTNTILLDSIVKKMQMKDPNVRLLSPLVATHQVQQPLFHSSQLVLSRHFHHLKPSWIIILSPQLQFKPSRANTSEQPVYPDNNTLYCQLHLFTAPTPLRSRHVLIEQLKSFLPLFEHNTQILLFRGLAH